MRSICRAGELTGVDSLVTITPETGGWDYSGLEVFELSHGPVTRTLIYYFRMGGLDSPHGHPDEQGLSARGRVRP